MIAFEGVTVRYESAGPLRPDRAHRRRGVGGAHRAERGGQDDLPAGGGAARPPRRRDHGRRRDGVVDVAQALARLVAYVPQQPELPPEMTVGHYVLLGRTPHIGYFGFETRSDRAVCAELLRSLDLAVMADRRLWTLSGGELQRLVLARALAQQAPVLLLDEPTSALDLGRRVDALELVDGLRHDRGLTVLSAMHDLTLAGQFADRLILLGEGRAVAAGKPDEVLTEETLARISVPASGSCGPRTGNSWWFPDGGDEQGECHAGRRDVAPDRPKGRPPPRGACASLVLVNTGHGKGKSSSAFGVMGRAWARGWTVAVVQFVKSGKWKVGERKLADHLGIEWYTIGDGFTWESDRPRRDRRQGPPRLGAVPSQAGVG